MKNLSELDNKFYRLIRSALTAIDGLWFLEVEKKYGFDQAFEIDLAVWKRYGPIMIKRIKKAMNISDDKLDSFLKIFKVLCTLDGTKFKTVEKSSNQALIQIIYCPWWENLKGSNRQNLVHCDIVDKAIFPEWAKAFNPNLKFELKKSLPDGDDVCECLISIQE